MRHISLDPRTGGFTLIELLVVIFIVGIIAAMATLSVGTATREKGLEKELERIGDLVKLAGDEAVLQNRELGLTFYRTEYEFSYFDPAEQTWTPLADAAGPFSPRPFPPNTEVELEIEGRRVALDASRPERKISPKKKKRTDIRLGEPDPNENRPQVMIMSSGDVLQPFVLRLRPELGSARVGIAVSTAGAVEQIRDDR